MDAERHPLTWEAITKGSRVFVASRNAVGTFEEIESWPREGLRVRLPEGLAVAPRAQCAPFVTFTLPRASGGPREIQTAFMLATHGGRGEFYSGIASGARVLVEISAAGDSLRYSVQDLERPGAWLAVFDPSELSEWAPADFGREEIVRRHGGTLATPGRGGQ